jgi:hypothetical protein
MVDVQTHFWTCPRPAAVETCGRFTAACLSGGTGRTRVLHLARPPDNMSDAIFRVPEPWTFLELHSKTLLKHFFHRDHKHPLSTGTLRQVPEALAQKMAEGLDFQKLTTTCTVSLAKCAGKYLHRHYCTWVKTTRLAVCHTVNITIKVCLRFQH